MVISEARCSYTCPLIRSHTKGFKYPNEAAIQFRVGVTKFSRGMNKAQDATTSSSVEDGVLFYKVKFGWAVGGVVEGVYSVRSVYWNTFLLEVRRRSNVQFTHIVYVIQYTASEC